MTALADTRDTKFREIDNLVSLPVAADAVIYAGAIVCTGADGYAVPGSTATTLKTVGRAEGSVDNTGGADGALNVTVRTGIHRYENSAAADEIAIADRYTDCYVVDDQTVAKTDGTSSRSVAGKVEDVDADGVWVHFDPRR